MDELVFLLTLIGELARVSPHPEKAAIPPPMRIGIPSLSTRKTPSSLSIRHL